MATGSRTTCGRETWRVLLLPLFFLSFARAARRAARGADVVHAHWLPSGIAGLATRKPLVVQLWGTDVELAKRLPWLFRPILRGRGSSSARRTRSRPTRGRSVPARCG